MSKNRKQKMITPEIMRQAVVGAFTKLDPRYMMKNPVMFVVEIGFVISLVLSFAPGLLGDTTPNARVYNSIVSAILFVTVLFANFAESVAEGRGKAQEYLLYSEDLGRSKRQFLLGKAAFLIFQTALSPTEPDALQRGPMPALEKMSARQKCIRRKPG